MFKDLIKIDVSIIGKFTLIQDIYAIVQMQINQ